MPVYTNPIIDQEPSPKVVYYVDNRCAIFTCNGSPEGVILANTGSIALSDNGLVYKKTTDDIATGWIELQSGFAATVPRRINIDNSVVGNVGAGLDSLHSFTIPANTLAATNDEIAFEGGGPIANNANTKRVAFSFDGQITVDSGLRIVTSAGANIGWKILGTVIRLTATTVRINATIYLGFMGVDSANTPNGFGAGGTMQTKTFDLTVANLTTNPVIMLFQAEGTANDDVQQNLSKQYLTQS